MISEQDIRRLVSGAEPENAGLAALLPLVRALRKTTAVAPPEHATRDFASRAALIARSEPTPAKPSRRRPAARTRPALRARFRLSAAGAALVLMLSASMGVAYAADSAAPGEALFALDTALEDLGIGNGGLRERLSEADDLVQSGHLQQGLTLAAEAITTDAPQDGNARRAAGALLDAAKAVKTSDGEQSDSVRRQVADRLQTMADTDLAGDSLGQAVSHLAHGLTSGLGGRSGTTVTTGHGPVTTEGDHSGNTTKYPTRGRDRSR